MEQKKEEILPIFKNPHKVLRAHTAQIPPGHIRSREIGKLILDMKRTLAATPDGVGLAAPQVGKPLALFIVSEEAHEIDKAEKQGWERRRSRAIDETREKPYEKREWKYYTFINPAVKNRSRKKINGPEGCLSVPGTFGTVARHEKITVTAYDEQGKKFIRGASRFFARVIQHELDHLAGILFIDKADGIFDADPKKND